MKISMKRIAALALALVMVIGLLPVMNNAVNAVDVTGLTDGTIGVSYVNADQPNANTSGWTASGNTITGNLQGVKKSVIYMKATSTLTITNNKSAAANLSFDYSFTTSAAGGTVTIDGATVTGGSFAKKLAAGESVVIVLSVPRASGKDNAMSISITNLILASASNDPVTTTFEAPAFGSYTVAYGGESLTVAAGTASQTATNLPSVSYTLTANPGDGYKMVGWYNATTDIYLGTGLTYTGSFEEACTVKAVIVPEDSAVFKAGDNYFSDLNEAVAYAQTKGVTQVTLVQNGVLPEGSYTIPAGITLLIPMDSEYTPTRTDDEDFGVAPEYTTDYTTPYAYLTMSMADGAKLTVNGTLDIESKHTTLQGGKATGGRPCGAYGAIYMNPEASITVNNGANLYAWGYIYGEGNVTANSGSKVYEIMQVTDFPGGSNMSQFVDTDPTFDVDGDGNPANDYFKTFPFSQYYVQNIEVALTLKSGAAEYVYITMTAGGQSMGLPVRFIGEGGMFVPGEGGTIVKDYDPSTDRLNVTVNGDASMAGIALDLSGTKYEGAVEDVLGTSKVDSASFILTLNGNITINIASGTTTVKQDLSLLPGVEINIAESATLVVAERSYADGEYDNLTVYGTYTGYNIYVWDLENWGNFVFKNKPLVALTYSPTTGRYVRTADDLKDVRIDINGTVICEGYIYSTVNFDDVEWVPVAGAGAAVISTGKTGTLVLQNGPGPEDMAYCLDGLSDKDSAVFVDSVWLLNGDGTYVLTEGCEPGTTYKYCDVHDLWYTEGHDNCVVIYTHEITWIVNGVGAPEEYTEGETPLYKGATPSKPADGCTVYTFAGWATSADGQVLTELPAVTGDAVYFAVFTESVAHNGELDYTDNGDTHSAVYDCCGAEYVTGEGHTYTEGLCACGKKQTFTIKWNNNGTIMETDVVEYGEVPVYNGATPTKTAVGYTYTFTGWSPAVVAATKDMTYNAVYSASVNSHFVILKDENGTELGRVEYEYNVIISQNTLDAYAQKKCYTLDDWYYENGQSFSSTRMGDEDIVLIAKWNGPNHSWVDADCDNDGYCSVCGEAGDPALGHSYNYDCDTNCSVCGKPTRPEAECVSDAEHDCQDGSCIYCGKDVAATEAHDWLDATCTEAATCGNCGATTGSALGHGHSEGWEYIQIDNDVHQVWCKDCYEYTYDEGHKYVDHVCSECGWTEEMSVQFYNGTELWAETVTPYGNTLGIGGMSIPVAPTGYDFAGWYTEGGVKIVHGMTVTENIVAYATWAKQTFTVTWLFNGGVMNEQTKNMLIASGFTVTDTSASCAFPYGDYAPGTSGVTKDGYFLIGYTDQYGKFNEGQEIFTLAEDMTFTMVWECVHSEKTYTDLDNGFHKVTCGTCGETMVESEAHDYSYDAQKHKCECGAVETFNVSVYWNGSLWIDGNVYKYGTGVMFGTLVNPTGYTFVGYAESEGGEVVVAPGGTYTVTKDVTLYAVFERNTYTLTVETPTGEFVDLTVPYGANLLEVLKQAAIDGKIPAEGDRIRVSDDWANGEYYVHGAYYFAPSYNAVEDNSTMPAENVMVLQGYFTFGWTYIVAEDSWQYADPEKGQLGEGWHYIEEDYDDVPGGAWYYFQHKGYSDVRVEGLSRVPYPTVAINGITYGPNMEDVKYYNDKGILFKDATSALFCFDENGKFQSDYTGLVGNAYAVNGYLPWHYGLVEIGGDYYYFKGDEQIGGNTMVTGCDYYLSRNNTTFAMVVGGLYTFGADGKLCLYDGITNVDGTLRYYENAQLMLGKGLTQVGENFIYVNSYGALVVDAEYYIGANSLGIPKGIYYFDAEGFLVMPEPEPGKEGLHFEEGKWYYYVDGAKAYCAGLIEIDGNWVYVKSDGSLATGKYYVTNTNGHATIDSGDLCLFDENGFMQESLNGVIDGYYYVDNTIAYAAGLVETENGYIYVRSNGQIVTGTKYWITNVNKTGIEPGYYEFDENGIMAPAFTGVKDGFYYKNGAIAYAAGLVEIDTGKYVYVRSNGQIATGKYWITNTNGLLENGFYDFGEDGYLTAN